MTFWRAAADSVSVMVKVQPKSRRPGLQGTAPSADGIRLKIGVSEAPEDGKANRAVCVLLADVLDVAQSAVQVTAGATSREKLIRVSGDPDLLAKRLSAL